MHNAVNLAILLIPYFVIGGIGTGMLIRKLLEGRSIYSPLDDSRCGISVFLILTVFLIMRSFSDFIFSRLDFWHNVDIYFWIVCFSLGARYGYRYLIWPRKKSLVGITTGFANGVTEDGVLLVNPKVTKIEG